MTADDFVTVKDSGFNKPQQPSTSSSQQDSDGGVEEMVKKVPVG